MAQFLRNIQNDFTYGQISQRLLGRSDQKAYYKSVEVMKNMWPYIHGGATRRCGSYYIDNTLDDNQARLIDFIFSNLDAFVIEFTNTKIRFYKNRGRITGASTVNSPYTTADLPNIKYTQSADVLYLFHPDYAPRKLIRNSDTSWTLSTITFLDGPYLQTNVTSTTLTPSATTGSITITASAVTFTNSDVGRLIRIKNGTNWGYVEITAFSTAQQVTATVLSALSTTNATTEWRLGAFSNTTGYPRCGVFHQQRLILAGTRSNPQDVYGSVVNDFENFKPSNLDGTTADDLGFVYTLNDNQVNAIQWLQSRGVLIIGTYGGNFSFYGGSATGDEAITPSNAIAKKQDEFVSDGLSKPVRIGNSILYALGNRRRVRELDYSFDSDSYTGDDLSLLAEDITRKLIIDASYQKEIDPLVWYVLADGKFLSLTYDKKQQVIGWAQHQIGGQFVQNGVSGHAVVESVCCVPNPAGRGSDIYLSVKRTINGSTKRFVEFIDPVYDPDTNGKESMYFVDGGLTYDGRRNAYLTRSGDTGAITFTASSGVFVIGDEGKKLKYKGLTATITTFLGSTSVQATLDDDWSIAPATIEPLQWGIAVNSVSGLNHLNTETVQICADGGTHESKVVTTNAVALDDYYTVVHVGYGYEALLQTLPPENLGAGSLRGRILKIPEFKIGIYNTLGMKYSQYEDGPFLDLVVDDLGPMDVSPPLQTKVIKLEIGGDYLEEPRLYIKHTDPLPLTVLFIAYDVYAHGS